jgi:hypothetical protein
MTKLSVRDRIIILKRKQSLCYTQRIMKMEKALEEIYIQHHNTQPANKTTVENKGLSEKNNLGKVAHT